MKSVSPTKPRPRARGRQHRQPTANPSIWARRPLLLALGLVVATVALYYPVHSHPFANFDDGSYFYSNPHVRAGLSVETAKWAFTSLGAVTPDVPDWHPITWLSHALDAQIFGIDPAGPHDVNLLLHALNVVLLFWMLLQATGLAGRSAMVAALFAVHPINVESVAWISERKNLLSMTCFLLALAGYRWYVQKPRVDRYLTVAVLFAVGLMAKPQIVSLPFVMLLWDYWPLQRVLPWRTAPGTPVNVAFSPRSAKALIVEKLPLLGLAALSCVITVKSQLAIGGIDQHLPFSARLANAIVSYARYLGKAFWPSKLALFYPHPGTTLPAWEIAVGLVVLLAISLLVLATRRRRYPVVGWLWFLGTLVPMIGLVQVNHQAMADRYAYLPFIGLFFAVCWGVADSARQKHIPAVALGAAGIACLLALSAVSYRQIGFWSDNLTLWSHALEVTHGNYFAENIVGSTLMDQGNAEAALPHFQAAVEMNPSDPSAYMSIGAYDQQHGKPQEAIEQYQKTIALTDDAVQRNLWLRSTAFARMGSAYRQLGELPQARESFQKALEINPGDGGVWLALGIVEAQLGDLKNAIRSYSQAVKTQASDVGYLLLARALEADGNQEQARAAVAQAQRLSRDFPGAERKVDAILMQPASANHDRSSSDR